MTLITDDELREWKAGCEGGAFLYDFETAGEYYLLANGRVQRLIAEVKQQRHDIAIYKDHIRRSGHRPEDMDKCTCHIVIIEGEVATRSNKDGSMCNVPVWCCDHADEVKRLRRDRNRLQEHVDFLTENDTGQDYFTECDEAIAIEKKYVEDTTNAE